VKRQLFVAFRFSFDGPEDFRPPIRACLDLYVVDGLPDAQVTVSRHALDVRRLEKEDITKPATLLQQHFDVMGVGWRARGAPLQLWYNVPDDLIDMPLSAIALEVARIPEHGKVPAGSENSVKFLERARCVSPMEG
jgi:hypothetical protein